MTAPPILAVENLSKTFNKVPVLDDISLEITEADGIVALIGPNAAGKSTLFNVLTGMLRPDPRPRATMRVFGQSVIDLQTWQIARLGVARLFQDARVFLGLTLLQNVQIAGSGQQAGNWVSLLRAPAGEGASNEALEFVGLAGRKNERADVLSLGDRRKLAIACMLRTGARLLLLDEPTANLDASANAQMKELILALARQSRRVVLIEHNFEFVREVANTVFVFRQGKCLRGSVPDSSPQGSN